MAVESNCSILGFIKGERSKIEQIINKILLFYAPRPKGQESSAESV